MPPMMQVASADLEYLMASLQRSSTHNNDLSLVSLSLARRRIATGCGSRRAVYPYVQESEKSVLIVLYVLLFLFILILIFIFYSYLYSKSNSTAVLTVSYCCQDAHWATHTMHNSAACFLRSSVSLAVAADCRPPDQVASTPSSSPLPHPSRSHMCLTEGKLANHSLLHLFSLFRRTLLPLS